MTKKDCPCCGRSMYTQDYVDGYGRTWYAWQCDACEELTEIEDYPEPSDEYSAMVEDSLTNQP